MFEKAKRETDAFSFSLGGMSTIASFTPAPAIASDRVRQARTTQPGPAGKVRRRQPALWLSSRRVAAECCCA